MGPLARAIDPPYKYFFSNPFISIETRRLLSHELQHSNWTYVEGTLYARVYGFVWVTRVDRLDDADLKYSVDDPLLK